MKAIVITGVSSGIGYDATRYLVDRGFTVFGSVRTVSDQQRLLTDFPTNFHALLFDMTDNEAIQREAHRVNEWLQGRLLTALVNNAGVALPGPLQLVDDDRFEHQMKVNVLGTRYVINAFLPMLGAQSSCCAGPGAVDRRPGKIINISSLSGILNTPVNGSYCVAKHAMESLGEVYRRELLMYGIDVVSIQPGPIQSRIWEKNIDSMTELTDSDYGPMIRKTNAILRLAQKQALPAVVVSRLILKIIYSRRPQTQYIVHSRKWLASLLARWVPDRWMDRLIHRQLSPSPQLPEELDA